MKNLKEKIKNKEKTIGTLLNMSDVSVSKIAGLAGYDFIWIDMEHSYISYETLLSHIIAFEATDTSVIVRVPQNDLTATKKIIDMGPDGIIFPNVKSAREINEVLGYSLYPPYGTRGFGPMNAIDYGYKSADIYTKTNHDTMCRFIQIEHKNAVAELETIVKNEFIDGYIFGPNDLSGSIDELLDVFNNNTQALINQAIQILKKHNKYIGLATGDTSDKTIQKWMSLGIDMLANGSDYCFLLDAFCDNRKKLSLLCKGISEE